MSSAMKRICAVAFTATVMLVSSAAAQAQGKWLKLAPFPEPAQEIAGTAANGKVYVFGGLPVGASNATPQGLVWEYDSATNKWNKKKRMPLPGHHLAVTETGGKIYVFGGGARTEATGGNWVPINNAWEYDPTTDIWKALPPMPTPRGAAGAVVVGRKIYVIGGAGMHPGQSPTAAGLSAQVAHRALPTNEAYDLDTGKWETKSPMPTSRNHLALGVINGKIYVAGGRLGAVFVNSSPTDVVEEYDPATDSWGFAKARMPMPRSGTAYGVYQNKLYVAGGEYLDNAIVGTFRSLEAYDPATNTWTSYPSMAIPRHGLVGGVTGDRFYVVSGHMQSGAIFGEAMDSPDTDAFDFTAK